MVYAHGAGARHHAQRADAAGRTSARFCLSDDEVLAAGRRRRRHRGPLQRAGRPADADGRRMGQGRHRRRSSTSCRRARKRWRRATSPPMLDEYRLERKGPRAGSRARGRRQGRRRPGARDHRRSAAEPVPAGRGPGRRHHHARLGHGDEDRRPRSSPTAAGAPAMPRSSRARSASRPSSAASNATETIRTGDASPSPAPRATPAASTPGASRSSDHHRPGHAAAAAHAPDGQPRQPGRRVQDRFLPNDGVGPGAHGIHRRRAHQGASDGAGAPGAHRRRRGARARSTS